MRIGFINDQIAIGGAINESSTLRDTLKKHKLTHIINLDKVCVGVSKVETLHYYIEDNGKTKPYRYYHTCALFALEVLKNPKNRLLIHCSAGRNRSVCITYLVLRLQGYSHESARKLIWSTYIRGLIKKDKDYRPPERLRYRDDIELYLPELRIALINE